MKKALSVAAIGTSTLAVQAQFSSQLQNLTVSFSPDDASSDCSAAPDARAISFSTSMAPSNGICFNLEDLFASNNTLNSTGYYNYTGNLYAVPWPISYTLTNTEAFNSTANYSRIWYQQTNLTGNSDEIGKGDAAIAINVYPDKDCRENRLGGADAPPDTPMWPWYGWSCQSEEEGQCRTTEYAVKSIFINDASNINSREGLKKCWDFAEAGDANGLQRMSFWLGFLGVAAAVVMAG